MSLRRDVFLKTRYEREVRIAEFVAILESFGELSEPMDILDHRVEPLDLGRDYDEPARPQCLRLHLRSAVLKDARSWNPQGFADDISAILALATGRTIRPTNGFIVSLGDREEIHRGVDPSYRGHPNLNCPIDAVDLQGQITRLTQSLIAFEDDDQYLAVMRSLHLYRDALILLPYDVDAAYMLLVAVIEALGHFSNIVPTFDDLQTSDRLKALVARYNLSSEFMLEMEGILLEPRHVRLRAKFVDVIMSNHSADFFGRPHYLWIPAGKDDTTTGKRMITSWRAVPAPWFMKPEQLEGCLKNIYDSRSRFVHAGEEWPHCSKISPVHDLISSIENDKHGRPRMSPDGAYRTEKSIPTFFWFERMVNDVLRNIIARSGKGLP